MNAYEQVVYTIEKQIDAGGLKPGDRLPTEFELAEQLSVHRLTVHKALRELQRAGKVVRTRGKGTFVAEPRSDVLSLLYVGQLQAHLYKDIHLALNREAQQRGAQLRSVELEHADRERWVAELRDEAKQADWVVLTGPACGLAMAQLPEDMENVMVIDLWPRSGGKRFCQLILDAARAVERGVDHLAALGHERIALLTTVDGMPEGETPLANQKPYYPAYRRAMIRHGLDGESQTVLVHSAHRPDQNAAAIAAFLRGPGRDVTAIVCDMDYRARELLEVARQEGRRVPDDLSVVGQGDTPWCEALTPTLTSTCPHVEHLAAVALGLAARGQPACGMVLAIEPGLVERESTAVRGPCRAG